MQMRFVDHLEASRPKRGLELGADGGLDRHLHTLDRALLGSARVMARVQRSRQSRNGDLVRAAACAHTWETMKFDSKYFDCVRVKPDHEKVVRAEAPVCQWRGCSAAGLHRAPRGRGREGQYYLLCLDHVRQFNASYNYFQG